MSENENQQSTIAVNLCKNGCGFYGSTQFDGMCSVCHKETMKKRQKQDEEQIQKPTSSPHTAAMLCTSSNNIFESDSSGARKQSNASSPEQTNEQSEQKQPAVKISDGAVSQSSLGSDSDMQIVSAAVNTNEGGHVVKNRNIGLALSTIATGCVTTSSDIGSASVTSSGSQDSSATQKRNRCSMCKKRIGLTGFDCRCGGVYCSLHRYSDKHNCQFDYQTHGQAEIRRANPQVVSNKIDKL